MRGRLQHDSIASLRFGNRVTSHVPPLVVRVAISTVQDETVDALHVVVFYYATRVRPRYCFVKTLTLDSATVESPALDSAHFIVSHVNAVATDARLALSSKIKTLLKSFAALTSRGMKLNRSV